MSVEMEGELHSANDPNPVDIHEVHTQDNIQKPKNPQINRLFKACCKLEASDLHLKANSPPRFRLGGDIRLAQEPPLSSDDIDDLIFEVISERQKKYFFEHGALDFAHQVPGLDRFRVNVFRQRGMTSVAARRVTKNIRTFEELGVPPTLRSLAKLHQGLILLAGITGSGKSTTIAALLNEINENRACHIVTVEDPIEYIFEDKKAFINQREIGIDVQDFHAALKYLMREDPDVVLVGEMRDRETFEAAMHASETGHLVLGTIHASSASQTITRILDLFPEEARGLIRQSLTFNLKAVICQKLLPSIHPQRSRIPCCEIMIVNAVIRKLIAEGRDFEIAAVLKSSIHDGMQDFTEALYQLVQQEYVDVKLAMEVAPSPDELKMRLKGIRTGAGMILG